MVFGFWEYFFIHAWVVHCRGLRRHVLYPVVFCLVVLVVVFCGDSCKGKVKAKGEVVVVNAIQAYGGTDTQLYTFLISALDTEEWSGVHPGCYMQSERLPFLLAP
jgi:hypothetical protein